MSRNSIPSDVGFRAAVVALQFEALRQAAEVATVQLAMAEQAFGATDPNLQALKWAGGARTFAPMVGAEAPMGALRAGDLARDATARSLRSRSNDTQDSRVEVPWVSQFDARVPQAGRRACYRAARYMAQRAGANPGANTENRIQVATGEDRAGRVQTSTNRTAQARSYIDSELRAGRPVVAGVSHRDSSYNRDGITDHFVTITGRGTDESGRTFYTYHDPATRNAQAGRDNRFYVDPTSGNLVHEGSSARGLVYQRHTELSMVVRNS